jgi:DNA-binding XRE family transcriptional regulator
MYAEKLLCFLKKDPSLKLAYDISKVFGSKIEDVFIFNEDIE